MDHKSNEVCVLFDQGFFNFFGSAKCCYTFKCTFMTFYDFLKFYLEQHFQKKTCNNFIQKSYRCCYRFHSFLKPYIATFTKKIESIFLKKLLQFNFFCRLSQIKCLRFRHVDRLKNPCIICNNKSIGDFRSK